MSNNYSYFISLYERGANEVSHVGDFEYDGSLKMFEFILRVNTAKYVRGKLDFEMSHTFLVGRNDDKKIFDRTLKDYLIMIERKGYMNEEFLDILKGVGYVSFYDSKKHSIIQSRNGYLYSPYISSSVQIGDYVEKDLESIIKRIKDSIVLTNLLDSELDFVFSVVDLDAYNNGNLDIFYKEGYRNCLTLQDFLSYAEFEGILTKEDVQFFAENGYEVNKNNIFMCENRENRI